MLDLLNNGEGVEDGHGNLGGQIAFNVRLQLWVPIWQDIMIEGQGIMETMQKVPQPYIFT